MADAAQYAIELAASMTGAESTFAELDALAKGLDGAGKDASHFQVALSRTEQALAGAASASADAQSALAQASFRYQELESDAERAARAVEVFDQNVALAARAASKASAAAADVAKLSAEVEALRAASAASASAVEQSRARIASLSDSSRAAAQAARDAARANAGAVPPELAARAQQAAAALATERSALVGLQSAARASAGALAEGERGLAKMASGAQQAAAAAAKAQAKIAGLSRADLEVSASRASAAVDEQAASLRGLEIAAEQASAKQKKLGQTMGNLQKLNRHVNDRLGDSASKLAAFRGALGDVGGPLGELGEKVLYPAQAFVDLKERFGAATAAGTVAVVGFAAVAAALVALAAIATIAVAAIGALAIKLADSARSAALHREALVKIRPELAALSKDYAALTSSTGQSADALDGLAKKLTDAKVKAKDLPAALRAAALAETALGAGGADQFIADLKAGKLAVSEFAVASQQKFGGIVARQMLGLEAQGARLKRSVSSLFGGLEITPALEGLRTLVDLFDENTAAGRAIKFLFETVFQPLIDQARNAAYVIEAFALGFLIGLTKVYIAIKPAIAAIKEFFGFEDTSLSDVLDVAKKGGEIAAVVFVAFVAVLGVLTAAFAAVAVVIGVAMAAVVAIGAAVAVLVTFIMDLGVALVQGVVGGFRKATDAITSIDWSGSGIDVMKGLANGIIAGGAHVIGAVSGAVKSAISTAKSLLGIASPSKVFGGIGENTGEGFALGVDDTTADAQSAMADLVAPPAAPEIPAPVVEPMAEPDAPVIPAIESPGPIAAIPAPIIGAPALPEIPQLTIPSAVASAPSQPTTLAASAVAPPAPPVAAPPPAPAEAVDSPLAALRQVDLSSLFDAPANDSVGARAAAPAPVLPTFDRQEEPENAAAYYDSLKPLTESAPIAPAAPSPAPAAPAQKAGSGVSLSNVQFVFNGVEGAEDAQQKFSEMLTRLLEGDVESLGGRAA